MPVTSELVLQAFILVFFADLQGKDMQVLLWSDWLYMN